MTLGIAGTRLKGCLGLDVGYITPMAVGLRQDWLSCIVLLVQNAVTFLPRSKCVLH